MEFALPEDSAMMSYHATFATNRLVTVLNMLECETFKVLFVQFTNIHCPNHDTRLLVALCHANFVADWHHVCYAFLFVQTLVSASNLMRHGHRFNRRLIQHVFKKLHVHCPALRGMLFSLRHNFPRAIAG